MEGPLRNGVSATQSIRDMRIAMCEIYAILSGNEELDIAKYLGEMRYEIT